MPLEYTKATFAGVWVLVLCAGGWAINITSLSGWAALAGLAALPPIVMWRVWTVPRPTMSESIRDVVR